MKNTTKIMKAFVAISTFVFFQSLAYSQSPIIQWQKSLGGSGSENGRSVTTTNDGGYIMAGYSNSNNGNVSGNHGGNDYWVVKTDATGNLQWQRSYGGSENDYASAIIKANDNGYIIAGYSASNDGDVSGNHGNEDYWIVKTDLSGNIQWQKSLGGSGWDWARALIPAQGGGYLITGASNSNNGDVTGQHGSEDIWVTKLDNNGNLQWQKCLGGSNSEDTWSVAASNDGGYILAGYSSSNNGDVTTNQGIYDYWIVKTDADANIQWQKSFGGSGYDFAYSVVNAPDGGYIVAGAAESSDGDVTGNHGSGDGWMLKFDNNGNLQWKKAIGGGGNDGIYAIVNADNSGYIFAVNTASNDGDVSCNHGSQDYWLVKTDLSGNILWQKPMGGSSADAPYSIIKAQDDGYVAAGHSASNNGDVSLNQGLEDYWLVHFKPGGICASCPSVSGLNGTGFRTTVRLQWTDYTNFTPVGYKIYRSTVSNSFGAASRTVGAYNDYTDYGLSPNTTYYYKIVAFDAAENESPQSLQITVATNNNNYLKVASLDLLIPIYKGDMTLVEPQNIRTSLEFARKFYFRNSKGQLNLKYHFMEIEGHPPFNSNGAGDFGTVGSDLINRGIRVNQYDAIHVEAIKLYGYLGGTSWLGQTGASMGHALGYSYDPDNHYVGGDAWLFTHEFGHTLDGIIAGGSGYPEMIFNHFPWAFPLPAGVDKFDAGPNFDGMALVLRNFNHHLEYAAPWNGYFEVLDSDNDGLADNDNRLAVDELSFGSNPLSADSDNDGLTDKQEFIAGIYSGSNPNSSDTDADGISDSADIYPISNFSPQINKTSSTIIIDGIKAPGEGWNPLVSKPFYSKLPNVTWNTFATWDNQYLYFTFESNLTLKYYINLDGSGEDGIFASPVRFPNGSYNDINQASYGDSYYESAILVARSDAAKVIFNNQEVAASQIATTFANGIYTTEIKIPQNLGPGFGFTYTPPGSAVISTQSYQADDILGLDMVALPLANATANSTDDWRGGNMISMNEVFHYYDMVLKVPTPSVYCQSQGNFPWHDWINNVNVGNINNNTEKSTYSDFTALTTDLTAGAAIPVSLTTGFSYFTYSEYWKIWIDYNKNGVFEEPGELAFSGIKAPPPNGTSAATLTGMLNIPAGVSTGSTRMRVSMKRDAYATPCETLPFGEVEDYTVNILEGNTNLADMALTAYADPNDEDIIHFYLSLSNSGPSTDTNITVDISHIPHFWSFKGANITAINNGGLSGGTLNYNTKIWTIPSLLSGSTARLDFTCNFIDFYIGPKTAFFEVMSSDLGDPDSSPGNDGGAFTPNEDDEAAVTIYPSYRADFIILAPNNPATAQAGNTVNFVFNLKNIGSYPPFAPFAYKIGVFLSGNDSWSTDDLLLQSFTGPYINPSEVIPFNASFNLPAGTPAGNYYLVIIADYEDTFHEQYDNNNTVATSFSVTTGGPVPYCSSYSNFPWQDWIAKVEIGGINNTSEKSAYSNFTSFSTSMNAGQSYPVKLTTGISYFAYDEYWQVWIDYNKNGIFETNEIAFSGILNAPPNGTPTAFINGTLQIPANAPVGSTRMRVSMKRGAYAMPCETLPFGEVEDYTVNIQGSTAVSYCNTGSDFPWHDWISRVKINTLDNFSDKSTYSDFTGLNTELVKNVSYTMTLNATFSWATYPEYWKVWIDLNKNGVFEEPGELVLQKMVPAPQSTGSTISITETVNIPLSALTGATRMRVAMKRGAYPGPCEVLPYGEVEDYTIIIQQGTNISNASDRTSELTFEAVAGNATVDLFGAWYHLAGSFDYVKDMTLHPNPATTEIFVRLTGTIPDKTSLVVYDAYNRALLTNRIETDLSEYRIDISSLIPGYYVVYIQREGKRWLAKPFVIVK